MPGKVLKPPVIPGLGIPLFGPSEVAAKLRVSERKARQLMRHGTLEYRTRGASSPENLFISSFYIGRHLRTTALHVQNFINQEIHGKLNQYETQIERVNREIADLHGKIAALSK